MPHQSNLCYLTSLVMQVRMLTETSVFDLWSETTSPPAKRTPAPESQKKKEAKKFMDPLTKNG